MPEINDYGMGGYGEGGYGAGGVTTGQPAPFTPAYYLSLLTSEYQLSPNLTGWLGAVLGPISDALVLTTTITNEFSLDGAVGAQLDVMGQILGASRVVNFQPSNGVSPTLDDATYRILLKAKQAQNRWDGRIDSLQGIWQNLFPGGTITITDGQNMAVSIVLSGVFSSILEDLVTHGYIVPRPQGVLYNYVFSALPIFGFDQDNAYISGFDKGKFA